MTNRIPSTKVQCTHSSATRNSAQARLTPRPPPHHFKNFSTRPLSSLYHLNQNAAHLAHNVTGRLRGRRCRRLCDPPCAPMSTGECRRVTNTLPHDGDRGEWAGGTTATVGGGVGSRCATAFERRKAAFEDSHGFNLKFPCTDAHWLLKQRARAQADWLPGLVGSDNKRRVRDCTLG